MPELAIIVPTRGRPENVRKVISAWDFTNAWDHADLVLAVDADDPEFQGYINLQNETRHPDTDQALFAIGVQEHWLPMVHKLNATAVRLAEEGRYFALAFAGDDHLPQTIGWAERYLTVLRELGSGMVYGDDGYQGRKLSTEWAVTTDAVLALGRMVPADVEHMYCDNAMMDLYRAAGCLVHLPEVRIEHMHPVVGKAASDDQYKRVNHRDQFTKDRRAYEGWRNGDVFRTDVAEIRHLRKGRPDVTTDEPTRAERPRVAGSAPRRVMARSGPRSRRLSEERTPRPPRHFRNVRAATPEDVMVALADFATQVPADQEIVELGVFYGRTALQLAWGASLGHGAHVTAIDPWDLPGNVYDPPFTDAESRGWARHWVDSLGFADKIELVHGFSHDVAETYEGKPVGLLYVDGDHTRDGAKRDIVSWARHLAPGARIAVDDYGHPDWPGVGEAVDELVAEGFLTEIERFHDRLAVARLVAQEEPRLKPSGTVTAITSEGVSPSPYPAVDDQAAVGPASAPEKAEPVVEYPMDADGFTDGSRGGSPHESSDPGQVDTEVSTEDWAWKVTPEEAVRLSVPVGPVADLNTTELRALAKGRGIVLGARKDKRSEMLAALKDGR